MVGERGVLTRRRYVASTGAILSLVGLSGCSAFGGGSRGEPDGNQSQDDGTTGNGGDPLGGGGPLRVTDTHQVGSGGRDVTVSVTVENTGTEARRATLVVDLSHTRAEGSISRDQSLLVPPETAQALSFSYRPQFYGGDRPGTPEGGKFRFDTSLADVTVVESYPGAVTPTPREPIADGSTWPGARYDARTSGHNPGTTAPRSRPSAAWTASPVDHAFNATGPVVADGTIYAGRPVRALSADGGAEQWVHDGPPRTSPLAVADGTVYFGTPEDFRALNAADGSVRWTVPAPGGNWYGGATAADGQVYTWASHDMDESGPGTVYAIDAASGDVLWTVDTERTLPGSPPVVSGTVIAGGDPLVGLDVGDGTEQWAFSRPNPTTAVAAAYDTVFALAADRLTALDVAGGRPRWFVTGGFQGTPPAVGDGAVYAQTARSYHFVALEATTGAVRWRCTDVDEITGPLSATSETVLATSENGTLYAVDSEAGDLLWSRSFRDSVPGSVPVADGVCYLNEPQGPLHALTSGK